MYDKIRLRSWLSTIEQHEELYLWWSNVVVYSMTSFNADSKYGIGTVIFEATLLVSIGTRAYVKSNEPAISAYVNDARRPFDIGSIGISSTTFVPD